MKNLVLVFLLISLLGCSEAYRSGSAVGVCRQFNDGLVTFKIIRIFNHGVWATAIRQDDLSPSTTYIPYEVINYGTHLVDCEAFETRPK